MPLALCSDSLAEAPSLTLSFVIEEVGNAQLVGPVLDVCLVVVVGRVRQSLAYPRTSRSPFRLALTIFLPVGRSLLKITASKGAI